MELVVVTAPSLIRSLALQPRSWWRLANSIIKTDGWNMVQLRLLVQCSHKIAVNGEDCGNGALQTVAAPATALFLLQKADR